MLWITILLFFGIVGSTVLAKSNSKWNPLVIALTLLMIVALGFQFRNLGGSSGGASYSMRWEEAVGQQLAKALSEDGIHSGTVVILDEIIEGAANPLAEIHRESFRKGLTSDSLNVVEINASDISTFNELGLTDVPEEMTPNGPVDLSTTLLMKAINNESDVVALVSFIGLPASMSPQALNALPPVYVHGLTHLTSEQKDEDLLKTSSIRAIVREKPGVSFQKPPAGKNLEEIFSEAFVLKQ